MVNPSFSPGCFLSVSCLWLTVPGNAFFGSFFGFGLFVDLSWSLLLLLWFPNSKLLLWLWLWLWLWFTVDISYDFWSPCPPPLFSGPDTFLSILWFSFFLVCLHPLPSQAQAQAQAQAHPCPLCLTAGLSFDRSCNLVTQGTRLKHLCLGPRPRSVPVPIMSPFASPWSWPWFTDHVGSTYCSGTYCPHLWLWLALFSLTFDVCLLRFQARYHCCFPLSVLVLAVEYWTRNGLYCTYCTISISCSDE